MKRKLVSVFTAFMLIAASINMSSGTLTAADV